jgi:cytoskeletal protein RodZ
VGDSTVRVVPGIMIAIVGPPRRNWVMGLQEYLLLVLVILVPLIIAVVVTLWTLEQARLRNKKNRKRPPQSTPDASATPPIEQS